MQCGRPVRYAEQEYCHDCRASGHSYDQGCSLWLHRKPVSWSVYQFKYHNQRRFAYYYGEAMAKAFAGQVRRWAPERILPIPLHRKRYRKRGYNQALLLAEELGERLGIPVDPSGLVRRKSTMAQKMLGKQERIRNMQNAFAVSADFVPVSTVLLIDDIYTTGSTIDAAALECRTAGVRRVFFITLAIGKGL